MGNMIAGAVIMLTGIIVGAAITASKERKE